MSDFPKQVVEAVWSKTNGFCWYCGSKAIRLETFGEAKPDSFTIDHIIPRCMGGKNEMENLVPCCWSCNASKRGKTLEAWRLERTRELSGIPNFNANQLTFLALCGFKFPPVTPHVFYFEEMGLVP